MSWVKLPAAFSASEIALKVEQRFGLIGFARLVKVLELLAGSQTAAAGIVSMRESDWIEALQTNSTDLYVLLKYLRQAEWAEYAAPEDGQPLVVTILNPEPFRQEGAEPVAFTSESQWATWCQVELGMTREVATDPHTLMLFRRWCVSRVSLDEIQAAAHLAATKDNSAAPVVLNKHVADIRKAALEKAGR